MVESVKLTKLIRDINILQVYQGENLIDNEKIRVADIYRPGLELTAYFDFYPKQRIQ